MSTITADARTADPTLLFGRDTTPGIVAVSANRQGAATVWRRVDGRVVREEDRFPHWFLATDAAALGLTAANAAILPPEAELALPEGAAVAVMRLRGENHYRDLVLARDLGEVERLVVRQVARDGLAAGSLRDLRDLVYVRSPVEQYLTITGRTYFKGMSFADLHRLQFDLEGTGLDPATSKLIMIAVSDSRGFRRVFDVTELSERDLIQTFVRLVQGLDPDVIENHNIFGFDLPYLVQRAAILGVPLTLGRDGGPLTSYNDNLKVGAQNEPFTRYVLNGREIIDTLHAVKRYSAVAHDMRNHGLKEAARHFGLARPDREYVEGRLIAEVFREDPERIRRYALDDVEEVAELSRLLLGASFALASMVPRSYEKIATAGTAQGLIEPLLVRVYLDGRHSLPNAATDDQGGVTYEGARTELFASGVIRNVVKADVASLYPSIMLHFGIKPKNDGLGVFLTLLRELTALRLHHKAEARRHPAGSRERIYHEALQAAMKILINSFYGSMGTTFNLFGDIQAAAEVTRRGRDILTQMLLELERRGVTLIEADTDGVLFAVPEGWTYEDELRLVEEVSAALPEGINVEHDGRYRAMYSYMEKNYALLDWEDRLKLVGVAFKSTRNERYAEQFVARAIRALLEGRPEAARAAYLETVAALRERRVPVEELASSVTLTKSPTEYRSSGRSEEQYEVLIASGRTDWRPGERVTFYRARGGRKKPIEQYANDYDAEHYVKKVAAVYAQRLSKAISPEDFNCLFGEQRGLFDPDPCEVRTVLHIERRAADLVADTRPANQPTPAHPDRT